MAGPPFAPDEPGRIELGTGRWLPDVPSALAHSLSDDSFGVVWEHCRSELDKAPQSAAASDPLEALVMRIATVIGVVCFVALLVIVMVLMVQRMAGS